MGIEVVYLFNLSTIAGIVTGYFIKPYVHLGAQNLKKAFTKNLRKKEKETLSDLLKPIKEDTKISLKDLTIQKIENPPKGSAPLIDYLILLLYKGRSPIIFKQEIEKILDKDYLDLEISAIKKEVNKMKVKEHVLLNKEIKDYYKILLHTANTRNIVEKEFNIKEYKELLCSQLVLTDRLELNNIFHRYLESNIDKIVEHLNNINKIANRNIEDKISSGKILNVTYNNIKKIESSSKVFANRFSYDKEHLEKNIKELGKKLQFKFYLDGKPLTYYNKGVLVMPRRIKRNKYIFLPFELKEDSSMDFEFDQAKTYIKKKNQSIDELIASKKDEYNLYEGLSVVKLEKLPSLGINHRGFNTIYDFFQYLYVKKMLN